MKKTVKFIIGAIAILVLVLVLIAIFSTNPQPQGFLKGMAWVDTGLYFVLDDEYKLKAASVRPATGLPNENNTVWYFYSNGTDYPKIRQLKYGQQIDGFTTPIGPKGLQKNVDYLVLINVEGHNRLLLQGTFVITDDNKIVMGHFSSKVLKDKTITVEKDGKKIDIPFTPSVAQNGSKVLIIQPVQEK